MSAPERDVYVGVGSNVGPEENIPRALALLAVELRLNGLSRFYRTAPVGPAGQPAFVNGVARVRTGLPARELKSRVLRGIEERVGRRRVEGDRYAPRSIDLDLLLCGGEVCDEPGLILPDPDLRTRPFLAAALLDLDAGLRLPDGAEVGGLLGAAEREALDPLPEFSKRLKDRFGI